MITKEKCALLKNYYELDNKLETLQKELKELNDLHDHVKEGITFGHNVHEHTKIMKVTKELWKF